jgi:hypothetical protein
VCLNVTIYPPDAVMPTVTRATRGGNETETTEDPDCHPFYAELTDAGTAAENQIRRVTVFLVDLDDKDQEQLTYNHIHEASVWVQTAELAGSGTQGYDVTISLKTTTGRKHLYVGANLSDDQIESFRRGNLPVEYTNYTDANLKEIMSHFMTLSDEQFTYTGSLISMFAKAAPTPSEVLTDADVADSVFVVNTAAGSELLKIDVEQLQLERTVSKVLLTCLASQEAEGYIAIQDLNETARQLDPTNTLTDVQLKSKYRGWVQQEEIYYILNIAARTQRLLCDSVATFGNYVQHLTNYDFVAADGDVYTRRYLSYAANRLNLSENDTVPFFAGALRRRAVTCSTKVQEQALREALATHEGVYCLPNLFRFRKSDQAGAESAWYTTTAGTSLKLDSVAKKVATYMLVAVRYVPRTLHCIKEGKDEEVTFETMEEALKALPDIKAENCPRGTYWAEVRTNDDGEICGLEYYTYEAMKQTIPEGSNWSLQRYRCYQGGFGYFITYIDAAQSDEQVVSYDYDVSLHTVPRQDRIFGLSRNHYYVLRTEEITVPGASALSGPMSLNAVLLDWNDRGSNDMAEVIPGTYE